MADDPTPTPAAAPPDGGAPVVNRVLRGYAPIAALALVLLLVGALVATAPEMRSDSSDETTAVAEGEEAGAAAASDSSSGLASNVPIVLIAAGLLGLVVLAIWAGTRTPSGPAGAGLGFFSVSSRLLRGYGPLAVLLVVVVVMGVTIPTLAPDAEGIASDTPDAGGGFFDRPAETDPSDDGGTDTTAGPDGTGDDAAGGEGDPGDTGGVASDGEGTGIAPIGGVSACPDRDLQVPGDEYSPPCVVWDGGENGGATAKGVTEDSILVSYRALNEQGFQQTLASIAGAELSDTPASIRRTIEAMAEYFNERFEFYGRDIEIVFYDGRGSNTTELLGGGRDRAQADAVTAAEEIGAFADLSATSEPYADALARRGTVGFGTPYLSRQWHEARAPFAWSLATNGTLVSEMAAEYANNRLYGKTADWAGGDLQGKERSFAVIAPENSWYVESVENATAIIEAAGNPAPRFFPYQLDLSTMSNQANSLIPRLKNGGFTTITCGCDPIMPVFLSGVANRNSYYPEFIIAGTALTDIDITAQLWDQNFAAGAFGISSLEPFTDPRSTIAYAAFKSVRPDDEPAFTVDLIYYQMYMLAIGIQGAGPELTPQSMADGLFNYPATPGTMGLWQFGPGDYTAAVDVREIYWDRDSISPYNGQAGAYQSQTGERWRVGEIPVGDPGVPPR